jgi:hypothetical protein
MKRAVLISGLVLMTSLLFHACSGPSKEKVAVVSTDTLQAEEEVMSEEELKIKETELMGIPHLNRRHIRLGNKNR